MAELTQQQKDDLLARFAGLKVWANYHHVASNFYVNEKGREYCRITDWSPVTDPAQWWLVLEALIKKKGWWYFIEACRKAIYKGNQPNVYNLDWLMPTVCATALEIIEQEGP